MSLIRSGYLAAKRWGLLAVLFSALLAPSLFHPSVAAAQEVKEIKLAEKHMQGFIVVSEHMAQLYHGANPDRPDPKLEVQAAPSAFTFLGSVPVDRRRYCAAILVLNPTSPCRD